MDRLPKNELCLLQKRAGQIKEKPKGGPLEEQIFQKSSQINSRIGLKLTTKILKKKKTCLKIYFGPSNPVHAHSDPSCSRPPTMASQQASISLS